MDEDMEMEAGATEGVAPAEATQGIAAAQGPVDGAPPETSGAGQAPPNAAEPPYSAQGQAYPPAYPGSVAQTEQQQVTHQVLSSAPLPPPLPSPSLPLLRILSAFSSLPPGRAATLLLPEANALVPHHPIEQDPAHAAPCARLSGLPTCDRVRSPRGCSSVSKEQPPREKRAQKEGFPSSRVHRGSCFPLLRPQQRRASTNAPPPAACFHVSKGPLYRTGLRVRCSGL